MCGVIDAGMGIVLGALGGSRGKSWSAWILRTRVVSVGWFFVFRGEGTDGGGGGGHAEDAERRSGTCRSRGRHHRATRLLIFV